MIPRSAAHLVRKLCDSMDNYFLTQYFDWNARPPRPVRWINRLLSALSIKYRLVAPRATGSTTSIEQRINMYHLLWHVLKADVPGDIVEIGCDRGSSAVLLQKVLSDGQSHRKLHVFDLFPENRLEVMKDNFAQLALATPEIHHGWIEETLPRELPAAIAFVHIDLGPSDSTTHLRESITASLTNVYPRLSTGAIVLVADYCDPSLLTRQGYTFPQSVVCTDWWHTFPAVTEACDEFLRDRSEKMTMLYGGEFSHGFFRKLDSRTPSQAGQK